MASELTENFSMADLPTEGDVIGHPMTSTQEVFKTDRSHTL